MRFVPRIRLLLAAATFLSSVLGVMLPLGSVAQAAAPATTCSSFFGEGGPFHQCVLQISTPESVPAGQTFTVTVSVMTGFEGAQVAKSDPCGSKVLITLDVTSGEEGPATSYTANARAGVATFNISLSPAGTYQLFASASSPETGNCSDYFYQQDTATVDAVNVPAGQPIAACPPDATCTQLVSGTGSAATLSAFNDGSFTATFGTLGASQCGFTPVDPNGVLTFELLGTPASKTVVFALSANLINKGIGQFNICWASVNPFTQANGTPAPLVGGLFTGILPNCKNGDAGPCVLFRKSGQGNVGFFGVLAPPGDPQAYPG